MMTRHCWKCGWEYTLSGQPGRGDSCHRCSNDLKVCLNCIHYDKKVAYQCKERRADEVPEKHMANYCEYFEMSKREFSAPSQADSRETSARDQLKKLLGD